MAGKSRGRPTKWETHVRPNLDKIAEWARWETEESIMKRLDVTGPTWSTYKKEHPELRKALLSKQDLVSQVRNALLKRALGFEYEETKKSIRKDDATGRDIVYTEITKKYSPPDVAACNSILQNMSENWYRDKAAYELKRQEIELKKMQIEENRF